MTEGLSPYTYREDRSKVDKNKNKKTNQTIGQTTVKPLNLSKD